MLTQSHEGTKEKLYCLKNRTKDDLLILNYCLLCGFVSSCEEQVWILVGIGGAS
jgi:hypothetical protein